LRTANSLRFPLSILRAFGREWHRLTGAPVPTVALNGSLIGYIVSQRDGTLAFNEIEAYPLPVEQIDGVIEGVRALVDDGVDDVLLFYYPRNWTRGEVIWTPRVERRASLEAKYDSAREIVASDIEVLRERLHGEDICMMTLLADVASDRRKAYQHTERQSFITRNGVDKLFGARAIAPYAAIDLEASVGAGDSELDTFLRGVGMAIVVGDTDVVLDGEINTVRLADPPALGALFYELASLIDARSTSAGDDAPRRRAATR
jgi:hydroxymethylpyrimidine pyrophosphatase-like HAD family hydrolase